MEGYNNIKTTLAEIEKELLIIYKKLYGKIWFYYTKSGSVQIVCFPYLDKMYDIYTVKNLKDFKKKTIKEALINKINEIKKEKL